MRTLIFILVIGLTTSLNAQDIGVKGGINYNTEFFKDVKNDVLNGAENKAGFHAGFWLRANLKKIGIYLRPELTYSKLTSGVNYTQNVIGKTTKTTYNFQKIDVPVLLGTRLFDDVINIFGGPSFQYILNSNFDIDELKAIKTDGFTFGLQFGAGVEFGRFGLDVRWERALTDNETKFINQTTSSNITFDTRVNQIIVGLSLKLN